MSLGYIGEPLPQDWVAPKLVDICNPRQWKTIPTKNLTEEGYVVYGANGKIGFYNEFTHADPTLMITCRGATCGNLHISESCSYINGNAMALDGLSSEYIGLNFLYYALKARGLGDTISGSAQPQITREGLKGVQLPLPPLAEQKIIVQKLDTLLAQVESTKARLERTRETLKRFRRSVLAAAVSGKLTEEWRSLTTPAESASELKDRWLKEREEQFLAEQNYLVASGKIKRPKKYKAPLRPDTETSPLDVYPSEWVVVSVSEFADCLDSRRVPVKKELRQSSKGLYPYFGANGEVDKVDEFIFDDDLVLVTEDETFYGREKPIAYRFSGRCWVNNHAHVLKAPTKESNNFLCYSLMYYNVIPWLSGTTGRAKLTQAALNGLPVGLPSLEEQTEIVRRVEQLFAHADTIEKQTETALARVNNLTQSILAKAFRGELTADWRAENPELISGEHSAEALLQKIKAQRATVSTKKGTTKKSRKPRVQSSAGA